METFDLSFVQHSVHRALLGDILREAMADHEVIGLLVHGSVARGGASPLSDLDILILLREGCRRPFRAEYHQGVLVEWKYRDSDRALHELEINPMEIYAYTDGRPVHDPLGRLARLVAVARDRLTSFRAPPEKRVQLLHWMRSTRDKIMAADAAGDTMRAAYLVTVNAWPILETIWAVNDRPTPPQGAVWAHLVDLVRHPPDRSGLETLFAGDSVARVHAALDLIRWLLPKLADASHQGVAE